MATTASSMAGLASLLAWPPNPCAFLLPGAFLQFTCWVNKMSAWNEIAHKVTRFSDHLPKLMELAGLGYTRWFVYRYLLFKSSKKELAEDIDSLKKKIAGTE